MLFSQFLMIIPSKISKRIKQVPTAISFKFQPRACTIRQSIYTYTNTHADYVLLLFGLNHFTLADTFEQKLSESLLIILLLSRCHRCRRKTKPKTSSSLNTVNLPQGGIEPPAHGITSI